MDHYVLLYRYGGSIYLCYEKERKGNFYLGLWWRMMKNDFESLLNPASTTSRRIDFPTLGSSPHVFTSGSSRPTSFFNCSNSVANLILSFR